MNSRSFIKKWVLSILVFLIGSHIVLARIVYVDKDASGEENGTTWDDAFNDITSAISDSDYGDQIWVASAMYQECIILKNGVALYGGFVGGETLVGQRDYTSNQTTIDADYNGAVVTITDMADPNTRVDGFVITKGDAIHGGGFHITASGPVIANNIITYNKTNGIGGGIYCFGFNPVTGDQPTIINNQIVDNLAYEDEGNGGGIGCHGSSPTIVGNIIARNIANRNGGGISCWASESDTLILSASPIIANNYIIANAANVLIGASGTNVGGGGIHCTATDLSGSPIEGAVCEAKIFNNVIAANGGWLGGGICTVDSIEEGVTITNNTIVANNGSGIFWQNTSPAISNNIVAFNTWGLEQVENLFTNPVINNNCVYGNTVKAQVTDFKGLAGTTGVNGNISVDPKLAAYTIGDLHIQPDSPCINVGDMNSLDTDWTDIDGQNRVLAGMVDMGADESDGTAWNITPAVIHVKPDGDDLFDGLSWATAKKTLAAGIDAAASVYGEVWVADGNYIETITLPAFVYLYGGFDGSESSRDQRNVQANISALDANQAGCAVTARAAGYLVSTVDGFTVKNGFPLIKELKLVDRGGGFNILCCSPLIKNNTITQNQADDPMWPGFLLDGGGLYSYLSYSLIENNTFSQNKVNHNVSGKGGAIYSYYSILSIEDNVFYDNAACWGPAICAEASEPYIFRNTIYAHQGPPYAQKGAITCYICENFTIQKNLIAANVASVGGGINVQACMSGQIVNNLIINNYAYEIFSGTYGAGGGIFLEVPETPTDTLLVVNNTIAGNQASSFIEHQGGGIALAMLSSDLICANNIVAFNSSGIWSQLGPTGTPTLKNNCVYNSGSNYVRVTPGIGDVSVDPQFVDMTGGNYRLSALSPLIDAGDNSSVPPELQTDGSEFRRFIDDLCTSDTGSGTAPIVDMGGYEFLRSDINSDGNLDLIDFAHVSSQWLQNDCDDCEGADLTCDSQVNVDDLIEIANYWLAGL